MLELVQTLDGHSERVWTVAWNPRGSILASSGADKTIRLWAQINNSWICSAILTETHRKSIRRLCWSPCGRYLASASFDSTVCIWQKNQSDGSWGVAVNLEGHESEVKSVAWSSDGNYLASCGRDRTIWIWERVPVQQDDLDSTEDWDCSDVKNDHSKDVKHILWHPKYNILASCSYDDTIKLFYKHGDDWKCSQTLTSHSSTVWSADFDATGELLVTCSDDKTVRVWKNHAHDKLPNVEPNSWKCTSVIQGFHRRTIYDVSWNKINNLIVSASGDNSLVLYAPSRDSEAGDESYSGIDRINQAHDCDVNAVTWNPVDENLIASAGDDRNVKIWKFKSDDQGRKPMTIVDEILEKISSSNCKVEQTDHVGKSSLTFNMKITDHSILKNIIQSLQLLQNELKPDEEVSTMAKIFNLKLADQDANLEPLELDTLNHNDLDNSVLGFGLKVIDRMGEIIYSFKVELDGLKLVFPKRAYKISSSINKLFLCDKTGDLFELTESGESKFLLGHLFMFSDFKFMMGRDSNGVKKYYIISADRDEKIRISKFPETYEIERFCIGHKAFVRRLIVIDDKQFISIDQQNNTHLWNLEDLQNKAKPYAPLVPRKTASLDDGNRKKFAH